MESDFGSGVSPILNSIRPSSEKFALNSLEFFVPFGLYASQMNRSVPTPKSSVPL